MEDEYKTTDIYLAAFMHASESPVELKRTERLDQEANGKRKVLFVIGLVENFIPKNDVFAGLQVTFFNCSGQVSANKYANALKAFKQLCFADEIGGRR